MYYKYLRKKTRGICKEIAASAEMIYIAGMQMPTGQNLRSNLPTMNLTLKEIPKERVVRNRCLNL
jgi:hypothetical protein